MSIRVAIAGVGNCASSLVQGVEYYKDTKDEDKIPGLMHNNFGGYRGDASDRVIDEILLQEE